MEKEPFFHLSQYSCDSVEFCPSQSNIFVCASYYLNPETRVKFGALDLHKISENFDFTRIQAIEVGAVLDSKW